MNSISIIITTTITITTNIITISITITTNMHVMLRLLPAPRHAAEIVQQLLVEGVSHLSK